MGTHLVNPGAVLADRYVIEDLLGQEGGSESWRARDRVLARSVVLVLLPSSAPQASQMLLAAKHASRIRDTRLLQVLDAADDGQLSYIVREWATGQSLDLILGEGPLAPRRATWLLRELSAAMVNAHRMGLPHRRLTPESVVLTKSSGVKLIGLGTAAALLVEDQLSASEAERQDTQDLGRLLYACLTARWPGADRATIPAAPTEHARLLRPRQVRAGVPRSLDAICDRILVEGSHYGPAITTVAEVKDLLTQVLAEDGMATTSPAGLAVPASPSLAGSFEPPPALLPREGEVHLTGEQPTYQPPRGSDSTSLRRTLTWTVLIVLVLGALLLAYLVGQQGSNPADDASSSGGPGGSGGPSSESNDAGPIRTLKIASVSDFDPLPQGSGDEHPELADRAIDDDPSSAWETMTYDGNPQLGGQKDGVGLIADLGAVHSVSEVDVGLLGTGTSLEIRAAPSSDDSEPPEESAKQYDLVATESDVGTDETVELDSAVSTRYVLIWLTSVPSVGSGEYRGGITNIEVRG